LRTPPFLSSQPDIRTESTADDLPTIDSPGDCALALGDAAHVCMCACGDACRASGNGSDAFAPLVRLLLLRGLMCVVPLALVDVGVGVGVVDVDVVIWWGVRVRCEKADAK
jgi:hypothetical protein